MSVYLNHRHLALHLTDSSSLHIDCKDTETDRGGMQCSVFTVHNNIISPLILVHDIHGDGIDRLAWTPNPVLLKYSLAVSTTIAKFLTDTVNENFKTIKLHKGSIYCRVGVLDWIKSHRYAWQHFCPGHCIHITFSMCEIFTLRSQR